MAYILIIYSGGGQSTAQQQQPQPQKPTLSLFGQPAPAQTTQPLQQSTATSTVTSLTK